MSSSTIPRTIEIKGTVTFAEVATFSTALATIVSISYSFGFFAPVNGSLISLLSIQDFLIGAAISLVPSTILIALTNVVPALFETPKKVSSTEEYVKERFPNTSFEEIVRNFDKKFTTAQFVSVILGIVAVILTVIWQVRYPHILSNLLPLAVVVCGSLFVMTSIAKHGRAISSLGQPNRWLLIFIVVVTLLFGAFAIGRSEYYAKVLDPSYPSSAITMKDKAVVTGKVLRYSSGYVFLLADGGLQVLPNSNVELIVTPTP